MRKLAIGVLMLFVLQMVVHSAVAVAATGYYIQHKDGRIFDLGSAVPFTYPYWPGQNVARDISVKNSGSTGYWLLDQSGGIWRGGSAGNYGNPYWAGQDVARAIDNTASDAGYIVLERTGNIFTYGNAVAQGNPNWAGQDVARDIDIAANGGYIILERTGNIFGYGVTTRGNPNWPGIDAARAISVKADGSGYIILDRTGNVFAYGSVLARGNPYWAGQDVARDIQLTSSGNGYWILNKSGQVFAYGDAPNYGNAPYDSGNVYKRFGAWKSNKWSSKVAWTSTAASYAPDNGEAQIYSYTTGGGQKRLAPKAQELVFDQAAIDQIKWYYNYGEASVRQYYGFDISANYDNDTGASALDPSMWGTTFPQPHFDVDDDGGLLGTGNGYNDESEVTVLRSDLIAANTKYRFEPYFNSYPGGQPTTLNFSSSESWLVLSGEYNTQHYTTHAAIAVPWANIQY